MGMVDSGASSHFVKDAADAELTGVSNKKVTIADGTTIATTHTAQLPLPQLRPPAQQAFVLPDLSRDALLSVRVFADNGYTTIFHPHQQGVTVHDNDSFKLILSEPALLQGWREAGGLWTVPMVPKSTAATEEAEAAFNVYELPTTSEVIRFHHAALGYPTKATLLTAARNGNLVTFPGLTPENISRFFPESDETQKGHMRQQRQGVRSTKVVDEDAMLENPITPGIKHKDVYLRVFDTTKKSMYTDQTGRFPITSSRGNKYTMVAVELDGNYIDAEPLKSRKAAELTRAYKAIHNRWKATGVIAPNWHILDNEAPEEFKQAIRENKCRVELTPADMHRRNVAERAIQTYKGHFISIIAGVSDDFPIHQWDELIPQAVTTLNLLRQSNVAPNVSAYAYHHGNFDYNRMPLAPLGCAVQFHIKPTNRQSWGEHSSDGWHLGSSAEHYRCWWVFVKETRSKRITDTVFFKHKYITQPTVTPADAIVKAYQDLTFALKGIKNHKGNAHMEALSRIQDALKPRYEYPVNQTVQPDPRVQVKVKQQQQQNEAPTFAQPDPRVISQKPPRLVVASPKEPVVVSTPKPILKPPKYIVADDPIASRTRSKVQPQLPINEPSSIAERVAQRRRESANAVLDEDTGDMLEYRQLLKHPKLGPLWNRSAADEFGRLAQGVGGRIKGTNTIEFIHKSEVPADRFKDVTYIRFVCTIRTEKKDPHRTRATMGGNLINYPDDVGTPTADLLLIKIFLNSVISTPGAKFANADISNFYLMTPLKRPEYAKIKLSDIPDEIIKEYKLDEKATADGWVYIKVIRGMYGLPQAGSLGHDLLEERLNAEGYFQSQIVPGFWKHKTRPIQFVLVVDDFGIKYIKQEDLDHLIASLEKHYEVTVDTEGREFVKIELDWDYENGKVHLSMMPYLQKALRQFDNVVPSKRQDSPYPHVPPKYGSKKQFAEYDTSEQASANDIKHIQKVAGKFLWYARGVDSTLLTPLSAIASQQSKATVKTMERVKQLLDFAATQEPAVLTYRKSDMVLSIHSDASYLSEENARSRAGGHHYLSEDVPFPPNNGAIHNVAEIIKSVMSSAAESELGSLYINARKGVVERQILEEMGHPQPATPVQTDNSTADGIINSRVQPKRTKAMDMRFHWLRDRSVNQKQFRFFWRPGPFNYADYWTKHHPAAHHRNMRKEFLTPIKVLMDLRKRKQLSRGAMSSTARVC